jgi:hypothetical protein
MDPNPTQTTEGRKRGPKPKIGLAEKVKVYNWLQVGASLADCADLLRVSRDTFWAAMRADPAFRTGVKEAIKDGKLRLVKKVGNAKPWQAAAWMLERKYGQEFGRKDRHEHTGANGGPIKSETKVGPLDLTKLTDTDLETLRELRAKAQPVPSSN